MSRSKATNISEKKLKRIKVEINLMGNEREEA